MSLLKMDSKLLSDYKKSLKECSKSDSGEPVTLSELPAYRFDEISAFEAERYRRKKKLCSADALYIKSDSEIYLFEFKNTRKSHISWKSVQLKAHDSLLTLQVALFPELSLQECAERTSYFLIYNDKAVQTPEKPSESFRELKRKLKGFAEQTDTYPVLGNMEVYQNTFYKKVYTIDVLDFEQEFLGKIYE